MSKNKTGKTKKVKPDPILTIEDLSITYRTRDGVLTAVDNVSLGFDTGRVTAIIGESGCGKSTIMNAVMGVLAPNGTIARGSRVIFDNQNILELPKEKQRQFKWHKASMVFQAAQNAMNPTLTVSEQLMDSAWDHSSSLTRKEVQKRVMDLLSMVRLDVNRVKRCYPHELSGGMRQRAIIAMAMVLAPRLVILDEPTTALDMITQHYIFDILMSVQRETAISMVLITHDIAIASKLSHTMVVMYGGEVMEVSPTEALFDHPVHPYTKGLLDAIPFIDGDVVHKKSIKGTPPDLFNKNDACVFNARCQHAKDICRKERPRLETIKGNRQVACHFKERFA